MSSVQYKVQNSLDECRMLILGGQVLVSFGVQAVFQPGFAELSAASRAACVAGTLCLVAAVGLLMWPAAYHRIAMRGTDTPGFFGFTGRILAVALLPFAIGLACGMIVVCERAGFARAAPALAAGAGAVSILAWYAGPLMVRAGRKGRPMTGAPHAPVLEDKIRHVLTEARMVLPGAQAMLGFATIASLSDVFARLPPALKSVHLCGLVFITLAVVLLMAPAAYHRIAERGEVSQRFHTVATRLLLAAMAALAPGIAAGVWLVLEIATGSRGLAAGAAAGVVALSYGAWFGWTSWVRVRASRCPKCHDHIRGFAAGAKCPECGG